MRKILVLLILAGFFSVQNFSELSLVTPGHAWTKKQKSAARTKCRKKFGKRLLKVEFRNNGNYYCHFRKKQSKALTFDEVNRRCKKQYKGEAAVRAVRKWGKWYCQYRW